MLLSGDIADEPQSRILGLAGNGDVGSGLGLKVAALAPVERNLLDETECIGETFVILGQVGRHLQRRRHDHVYAELVGYRAVRMRVVRRVDFRYVHLEYARRIVHRPSDEARERKYRHV